MQNLSNENANRSLNVTGESVLNDDCKNVKNRKKKFSWNGLEFKKEQLIAAANAMVEADKKIPTKYLDCQVADAVFGVVKGQRVHPDFMELGEASRQLNALHEDLVVNDNMDWDVVHAVWEPILNNHHHEEVLKI